MEKGSIKFTVYLPPDINKVIEFLRFKERLKKNAIILEALKEYLPKKLAGYPNWTIVKNRATGNFIYISNDRDRKIEIKN